MSALRGIILALMAAAVAAFILGFFGFADGVRAARPPDPPPEADAIVVLTGGARQRLETGVRLLREGHGRRLLISGVNPEVRDAELFALIGVDAALSECCVDLGRTAEDTLGNASETSAWARRNGFRRILLVTDDYHMPRSLAELRLAAPEAEFVAYPVRTRFSDPAIWRADLGAAARLGAEYGKYLMIRLREAVLKQAARVDAEASASS